jgi:hypothetical protein
VEKDCRAGQATDDSMAHAHCVLDNKGNIDTLSEYVKLNCFSTATVVARTRLNFTFIRTLPILFTFLDVWLQLYNYSFLISEIHGLIMATLYLRNI